MPGQLAAELSAIAADPDISRRIDGYRRLCQRFPEEAVPWFNLATELLAEGRRREGEAVAAARRSIALSPTMYDALDEELRRAIVRPLGRPGPGGDAVERRVGELVGGYRVLRVASRSDSEVLYDALATDGSRAVSLRTALDLPAELVGRYLGGGLGRSGGAPGCARVVEVIGDEGGHPWQVLERFPGTTLTARYASAPLLLAECLAVATQAARLLGALHQRGLYHGELHPDRVAYQEASVFPELTLLGGVGGPALSSLANSDERARWLAPELRMVGAEAGAAADVFGLGALLYFLATGRSVPWLDGAEPQEAVPISFDAALALRGYEEPGTTEILDHIDRVLGRCLLVNPDRRLPSAQAFIAALAR